MAMIDWALATTGATAKWGTWASHITLAPNVQDDDDATYVNNTASVPNRPVFYCDLNEARTIMGAGLVEGYNGTNFSTEIKLWKSTDNVNWEEVVHDYPTSQDWDVVFPATVARYWMIECLARDGSYWVVRTFHLWEDTYVNPEPPAGTLVSDLQQKIATQYADVYTAWLLLQAAPTNCEPSAMLAVITLWNNWLLNQLVEGGGTGGNCLYTVPDPDNQALFDRIVALEDQVNLRHDGVDILIGALATKIDALEARIFNPEMLPDIHLTDLLANYYSSRTADLDSRQLAIETLIANSHTNTRADLRGALDKDHSDLWNGLFDPTWGAIRQINDNTNGSELAIRNDVDAAEAAILAALATIQADTDDIQETLGTLSIPAALSFRWPGSSGVTFGSAVPVSGATEINATCHGAVVNVVAYPPGQSRQIGGSTLRYKGIGWLAFRSDRGDYEAIEQIHLEDQVIITKQLEQASGMAVYCKPGANLLITPFTIDGV